MQKHIALFLTASTLLLAGCSTTPRLTKWEYKQVYTQVNDASLNKLGDEGWSVVACGTSQTGNFYVLQRPKK